MHPSAPARRCSAWWLAVVLGVALAVRIGFFSGALGWDDVRYWDAAWSLRRGDVVPRSMFGVRYGLIVPLAITQAWFGQNEHAAAMVPLVYSSVALVLVYAVGKLYGGPRLGLMAAAFLAIIPLEVVQATDLHTDLPLSVFWASAMYAVKRGEMGPDGGGAWFVGGGLALGLAYLTKEIAPALLVVLILRLLRLPRTWMGYGRLGAAFLVVVGGDMLWLWWTTGNPFYRYSISAEHVMEMVADVPPSYEWLAVFPGWLLNPLDGYFGVLAGIFYPVLAGTLWGMRRGDEAVRDLVGWWGPLLVILSFAPLDASFTRPLFVRFPRTLHPLVIPFVLTTAVWLHRGLGDRKRLRAGMVAGVLMLAAAGIWTLHFDVRLWASVARQAARFLERVPAETLIATDERTAWLLHALLPDRRSRVVGFTHANLTDPSGPTLVLRDPAFLTDLLRRGHSVPACVVTPPPVWEKVAEFPRPRRRSLRGLLRAWVGGGGGRGDVLPLGGVSEPAVLWGIPTVRPPAWGMGLWPRASG